MHSVCQGQGCTPKTAREDAYRKIDRDEVEWTVLKKGACVLWTSSGTLIR